MNVLFISPYLPGLGLHAGAVRMYAMLRGLSRRHRVYLVSIIDDEPPSAVDRLRALCAGVRTVPRLTRGWPLPATFLPNTVWIDFDSPEIGAAIESVRAEHAIDVAAVKYEVMARHLPRGLPAVLTVYELQSHAAFRRGRQAAGMERLRHWGEMLKWLNYERRVFPKYRTVVTITEKEKRLIHAYLPGTEIEVIPMGADGDYFSPRMDVPQTGDFLFVGNFGHLPNVDAMRWFCGEILPRVRRTVPSARIDIVGYKSAGALRELEGTPGVRVVGQVGDIRPWLAASRVFVNPIRLGSGMRGKLIEAFAMARPVISTSIGAQGLEHLRDTCFVAADGPEEFARAAAALLQSAEKREALGKAAHGVFNSGYEWEAQARTYGAVLERAAAEGRNR